MKKKTDIVHIIDLIDDLKLFLDSEEYLISKDINPFKNEPYFTDYKNNKFDKPFFFIEVDKLKISLI